MKIFLGDIVLARGIEFGEVPIDLKISGQRSVQILSTIRGGEIKAIDRGNLATRMEFRVRKKHESAECAQSYAIQHASALDTLHTDLTLIGEENNTIYYLKNAVIAGVESSSNANISEHFYKIVGGSVLASYEQ